MRGPMRTVVGLAVVTGSVLLGIWILNRFAFGRQLVAMAFNGS